MTDNQQVKVALLTYPDPPDLHPGERSWREFARWVVGVVAAGPCGEPDRHEIFAVWWAERLRQARAGGGSTHKLDTCKRCGRDYLSVIEPDWGWCSPTCLAQAMDAVEQVRTGATGTPPATTDTCNWCGREYPASTHGWGWCSPECLARLTEAAVVTRTTKTGTPPAITSPLPALRTP